MPEVLQPSRFLDAQNACCPSAYETAVAELRAGRKRGHWIWFVLPQLRGLGSSAMSQQFGINGLAEAKSYLADPKLRFRLQETITVIKEQLQQPGQSLERLMGGRLDATKTISSLTLFEAAGLVGAGLLLDQIGSRCEKTQCLLIAAEASPHCEVP